MPSEQDFKERFDSDPEFKSHFLALPPAAQEKVVNTFRETVNPKLTPPAALPWDKQVNQMAPTDLTGEMPQNLRPLPPNATMGDKIGQAYQNIGASTADDAAGGRMALPFMLGGAEAPAIEAILAKTGAKAAGSAALRALLWGGAGAGVDAALGGDHPVRTGLETAGASLVPEIPGANKLLRLMLPPKFRAIFDMLPNSEKEKLAEDTWRASGKAKVTKFGGPADPGYSPPSGPVKVKLKPVEPELDATTVLLKSLGLR